jgi:hypothetical protein
MPRSGLRARHSFSVLSILALFITTFSPISLSQATAAPALVTCVNLQTGTERISHTGKCRYSQEAQANWHKNQSDSPIASGPTAKVINICSNKESSPVSYQVIRKKCARHQVTTIFSRSGALPAKPVIAEAVSFGHDSASLKLAQDPAASPDAPIAFYTITSTTVDTRTPILVQNQKVYYWKDLSLAINTLQASTRYTFTVSATTADGTSPVSISSIPVTTPAYVPPAPAATTASLAVPAFSLSASAETKTVNTSITGYTITSTGGTIASYAISPAAPAGTTFNTSTGLISGTPTSTQSAITYTITATNASGTSTGFFALTVTSSLALPVFNLSSVYETKTVGITKTGYSISSTGGTIASFSITPTLPGGLIFDTSTGLITGSPTETKTATVFTVTATNASGSSSQTYRLRVTGDIGDTGPGGGVIFYYLASGFKCGTNWTTTGSPTGTTCKYLEAAPRYWNGPSAPIPTRAWAGPSYTTSALIGVDNLVETGTGRMNTRLIIEQGSSDSTTAAAPLAASYVSVVNGETFSDWYLGSQVEMITFANAGSFSISNNLGINWNNKFWSSTSVANTNGRWVGLNLGVIVGSGDFKTQTYSVHPIRAF